MCFAGSYTERHSTSLSRLGVAAAAGRARVSLQTAVRRLPQEKLAVGETDTARHCTDVS